MLGESELEPYSYSYGSKANLCSCKGIVALIGTADCLCREMLETPGPYLLDVMVPHIEHVLPMIPGGGSYKDIITTGDGSIVY